MPLSLLLVDWRLGAHRIRRFVVQTADALFKPESVHNPPLGEAPTG
jgi:hypothetical protein